MSGQTPTPYKWLGDALVGDHGRRPVVMTVERLCVDGRLVPFFAEHPNAAFVLKACNLHGSLLAVASAARTTLWDALGNNGQELSSNERLRCDARQVIALLDMVIAKAKQ